MFNMSLLISVSLFSDAENGQKNSNTQSSSREVTCSGLVVSVYWYISSSIHLGNEKIIFDFKATILFY